MHHTRSSAAVRAAAARRVRWTLALAAALGLAACGGGGNPNPPALASVASVNAASAAPASGPGGGFQQLVVFGDSLSDVGTYTPAAIAAYGGAQAAADLKAFGTALYTDPVTALSTYGQEGGQFTVNPGPNWVADLATSLHVPVPLPNQIGYGAIESSPGVFTSPIFPTVTCQDIAKVNPGVNPSLCSDYAQGGSRVALQPGIGHYTIDTATGLPYVDGSGQPYVSALTVPVSQQVSDYLGEFSAFNANQLIAVLAGNNDIFVALGSVSTQMAQGVPQATAVAQAQAAVGAAADALAGVVQTIVSNGGKYVVVYALPDSALTPFGQTLGGAATCNLQDATQPCYLLSSLVNVFNQRLLNDLQGQPVKMVDGNALLEQEIANPAQFGFTNTTTPWCSPQTGGSSTSQPNSLLCNQATPNAAAGATTSDLGSWLFADDVHPTPAGYQVIATATSAALKSFGWIQ